jgi:hypothetical protein
MESAMPMYGNWDFLLQMQFKLGSLLYKDQEESYYQQSAQNET